ncbi:hypothetical protein KM427_14560 [Nocardioides sp. LMS-CY]|uniref:hypothetical protein n=1 Tax=Nocardioides sp. (strain LMS-CY) TaxID=2840457 RepID=UPI001C0039E9|nr:hypothetical protein [Nocardioides sp. LMS-CY]QWF20218.1 hypothetical protein KM427_14560 [Nocardioides sp. LMS-CY]
MPLTSDARRRRPSAVVAALAVLGGLLVAAGGPASEADRPTTSVRTSDVVRMRASAPIVLTGPGSASTGSRVRLRGDVVTTLVRSAAGKRARPRPVHLLERVGGRWKQVARTSSSRSGAFAFRVAAGNAATTRTFRAEAPASRGRAKVRSRTVRVTMTATAVDAGAWETLAPGTMVAPEPLPADYQPAPPASDWSYLFDEGSRWNPCAPVRWAYNPDQQTYDGAFADVVRAYARISAASGLQFQYAGRTAAGYRGADADITGASVDLVVSWATAAQFPKLSGTVVGVGGGTGRRTLDADVRWRMVLGYLVLDAEPGMPIAPGFDGSGWGQIMQHEILHALGLGHAVTPTQLMYGAATSRNARFGAGDLTGMTRIGSGSGCLS